MTISWDQLTGGMLDTRPRTNPTITLEQAYLDLTGSDTTTGAPSATNRQDATKLFKTYDASSDEQKISTTTSFRPSGYSKSKTDPTIVADFLSWNSAWQKEYVKANGTGSPAVLLLGGSSYSADTTITAVLTSDHAKVLIVDQLQPQQIGYLSSADQAAIANTDAFKNVDSGIGQLYSLSPTGTETSDVVRSELLAVCESAYKEKFVTTGSTMTDEEVGYFKSGIDTIKSDISSQSIFNRARIKEALDDIKDRYDRAYKMVSANAEVIENNVYKNVMSPDGGAAFQLAYRKFIDTERNLARIDAAAAELIQKSKTGTAPPNAVTLVTSLQFYEQFRKTYIATAQTAELRLYSDYVSMISQMQKMVSSTLEQFTSGTYDPNAVKSIRSQDNKEPISSYTDLPITDRKLASVFDTTTATEPNPLEAINDWVRPTFNIMTDGTTTLKTSKNGDWDSFANNLSSHVTTINSAIQIRASEITKASSEANKHYDLATGSIARMIDLIQYITSAGD